MAQITVALRKVGSALPEFQHDPGEVIAITEDGSPWAGSDVTDFIRLLVTGPKSAWLHLVTEDYRKAPVKQITAEEEAARISMYRGAKKRLLDDNVTMSDAEAAAKAKQRVGNDEDFSGLEWTDGGAVVKLRRFYFNPSKLPADVLAIIPQWKSLLLDRQVALRKIHAGLHALSHAAAGSISSMVPLKAIYNDGFEWEGKTYADGLEFFITAKSTVDAAIEALVPDPITVPSSVVDDVGTSPWLIDRGEVAP